MVFIRRSARSTTKLADLSLSMLLMYLPGIYFLCMPATGSAVRILQRCQ